MGLSGLVCWEKLCEWKSAGNVHGKSTLGVGNRTIWTEVSHLYGKNLFAVIERAELKGEFDHAVRAYRRESVLRLRHLERIALGTSYPEAVDRVVGVTGRAKLAGRCHLAADGTGVGGPVVDLICCG